jgi:hypothetical protein
MRWTISAKDRFPAGWVLFLVMLLATSGMAMARLNQSPDAEVVRTNRDITVPAGEQLESATCWNCSVHVRGKIAGDVAVFHGKVMVESGGEIDGDVAAFLGDVRIEDAAKVNGDVAAFGGKIYRDANGSVGGDQAAYGKLWFFAVLLLPFVVIGLLITLVVWLVRRGKRSRMTTA